LTKKRILTLYLTVVEWGPGVFGVEAAALEHFGVSAANVSAAQAALLAAMLPAPRKRSLSSGSPALKKRAHWVVDHYVLTGRMSPEAARDTHAEVDRALP
jgi:monofunctional biosynthetic peptidoglycan transglycosylase